MQHDNEKGLSGNHYATKLNHIIWNPASGNSESGNQSALLAMLGSSQASNDNSEITEMAVTWKDFHLKVTEIAQGNQLNENSVFTQTAESFFFS